MDIGLTLFFILLFSANLSGANPRLSVIGTVEARSLQSGETTEVSAERSLNLNGEPMMLSAPGKVPILLYPVHGDEDEIKVLLPDAGQPGVLSSSSYVQNEMSAVLIQFTNIQSLIAARRLEDAKQKLSLLEAQYPQLTFLEFLKASILALSGEKTKAIEAVSRGIASHPDYELGQKMKKDLGEGK